MSTTKNARKQSPRGKKRPGAISIPAGKKVLGQTQASLGDRLGEVRRLTVELVRPLAVEDCQVQPFEWVSPPKWHLAHTTWFFETFVLAKYLPGYRSFDPSFAFLFNSYYDSVGPRAGKARRGAYSRPTLADVLRYRAHADEALGSLLAMAAGREPRALALVELGLHHEQQHQELLLCDIKAILHANPSRPAYGGAVGGGMRGERAIPANPAWVGFQGGIQTLGHAGEDFAFDNEKPAHRVLLEDFRLAGRPVLNHEYLAFMEDGGYDRPELWLSDGWRVVNMEGWRAPLYWEREVGAQGSLGSWQEYSLRGMGALDPAAPVCHVSYYEADAFARWRGVRLPTEAEWESAARASKGSESAFLEGLTDYPFSEPWHAGTVSLERIFGDVWEWTASAYSPYPGFKPLAGAVGEYNGKFMVDQMVLRGGSRATPKSHIRPTYRNFFPASTRWQFSGLRLAEGP